MFNSGLNLENLKNTLHSLQKVSLKVNHFFLSYKIYDLWMKCDKYKLHAT